MIRRKFILQGLASSSAAILSAPAIAQQRTGKAYRNISGFSSQRWQDHFKNIDVTTIVCDTKSRALHYWSAGDGEYRVYPTSIPRTEDLTRRGYTEIVRKKIDPTWTPTARMRAKDPSLPQVFPAGPGNPLGTHALYLSWPTYLIHGTHDANKIGRKSSAGCIGLYNRRIEELFAISPIGTQVRII